MFMFLSNFSYDKTEEARMTFLVKPSHSHNSSASFFVSKGKLHSFKTYLTFATFRMQCHKLVYEHLQTQTVMSLKVSANQ